MIPAGPWRCRVFGCQPASIRDRTLPRIKKDDGVECGVFASADEVFLEFSQGKAGVHASIKLHLPTHKRLRGEGEREYNPAWASGRRSGG